MEQASSIVKQEAGIVAEREMRGRKESLPIWYMLALLLTTLLALFLNFFHLGYGGYGNIYYAAADKSMLLNWHNFFYVSFDPGGFVSVDKPPLAFWLQVASARLFGFHPWSLMLPQALAGVLSVPLLAYLVRRTYGPVAGLLAAITLAVTPVAVVTNRNLTMDSLLTFVLLLAAGAVLRAIETRRLRWLVLSFALVGVGFNIKMLDAYLVLPAFMLLYWFSAPSTKKERLRHLGLAFVVLLVVSFCWIMAVDLTPAAQRPFVGSSSDNSELQLALFYNGGDRFVGDIKELSLFPSPELLAMQKALPKFAQADFWIGNPGLFRLVTTPMGDEIGWLLPLAILGLLGVVWDKPSIWPLSRQQQGLALWGIWFLGQFIFFTSASFMHQYYVVVMAPAVAALLAIGIVTTWQDVTSRRRRWFLPLALLLTVVVQMVLLASYFSDWERWLMPLVLVVAVLAGGLLYFRTMSSKRRAWLLGIGLGIVLITPTIWSAISVFSGRSDAFPYAGPDVEQSQLGNEAVQMQQEQVPDPELIQYLLAHQGHARYLAATIDSTVAAPIILGTDKPVMAMGGYAGGDQILSVTHLQQLVANGTVHYFVLPQTFQESGAYLSPGLIEYQKNYQTLIDTMGIGNSNPLVSWIRTSCTEVPEQTWHSSQQVTLLDVYDCA